MLLIGTSKDSKIDSLSVDFVYELDMWYLVIDDENFEQCNCFVSHDAHPIFSIYTYNIFFHSVKNKCQC